jgi:hypothetical protein
MRERASVGEMKKIKYSTQRRKKAKGAKKTV